MSVQTEKIKELVELRAKARMGGGEKPLRNSMPKANTRLANASTCCSIRAASRNGYVQLHRCTNFGMEKKQYLGDGVVTGSGDDRRPSGFMSSHKTSP